MHFLRISFCGQRLFFFITPLWPRVLYEGEFSEGELWGCRAGFCGRRLLCFCWLLIWFFSWRPGYFREFELERGETSSAFFFFFLSRPLSLCLMQNWRALPASVVRAKNKNKWHMTRTQCLNGPAEVSGPHLLQAISSYAGCLTPQVKGTRGTRAVLRRGGGGFCQTQAFGIAGRSRPAAWTPRHTVSQLSRTGAGYPSPITSPRLRDLLPLRCTTQVWTFNEGWQRQRSPRLSRNQETSPNFFFFFVLFYIFNIF